MSISNNFDSRNKNIDTIIDALVEAQRDAGLKPNMREVIFDPVTNERVNRFKRAKLESDGVDLSGYGNNSRCSGCKSCGKKEMSNIERGVFVYSEDDLIDETDDLYICEFCTVIGFDQRYKPELCDACSACDECRQYMSGECDGCGYSFAYNGRRYGASDDVEVEISSEDASLFEELENDVPDYEVHYPTGGFTIMDYD